MWVERFAEMQEKVNKYLIGYQDDFLIDQNSILNAPEDTYLWMLRKTGTQLVNLTQVNNGECKITETALYYFYRLGQPYQMYVVNADEIKRLTKKAVEKILS